MPVALAQLWARATPLTASYLAQQAPLTPEYQKILEASLADQATGGPGFAPDYLCISSGMPMRMTAYNPLEFIITADTTHVTGADGYLHRRIYTDGRDWPTNAEPSALRSTRPSVPAAAPNKPVIKILTNMVSSRVFSP
jgi:hypothetical protein